MDSLHVVYTATALPFWIGYDKVKEEYPDLHWVVETDFRNDVMAAWLNQGRYAAMFVDDDVCLAPLDMMAARAALDDPRVLTYSPRLGLNTEYCYSRDIPTPNPEQTTFQWANFDGDLCYPGSIDGNIFRTEDLVGIRVLPWNNQTNIETALSRYVATLDKPLTVMPERSALVGLVVNMVQSVSPTNRCPHTQAPEFVNEQFLAGKRIRYPDGLTPNAAHVPWTYEFENGHNNDNRPAAGLCPVAVAKE
jgi:hypothetical protein